MLALFQLTKMFLKFVLVNNNNSPAVLIAWKLWEEWQSKFFSGIYDLWLLEQAGGLRIKWIGKFWLPWSH